jgi:hypothetical protein
MAISECHVCFPKADTSQVINAPVFGLYVTDRRLAWM